MDVGELQTGGIDQRLVGNALAAAAAGIGGDQQLGPRIVDAQRQVVRGEAAEHHRVHRADARAGQHRVHRLGHVRHVDDHAVAALHVQPLQHRGEGVDLAVQLRIRDLLGLPGFAGHRDQRQLRGAFGQMPVHRVVAQIGQPADEPAPERRRVVLQDRLRRALPVDRPGLLGPELFGPLDRTSVQRRVVHAAPPKAGAPTPSIVLRRGGRRSDLGRRG
ncbi:hypothetical protein NB689_002264 [Xanthomonas sacchari]|nr:hypothetical protein [Xanthomonas sacchari]